MSDNVKVFKTLISTASDLDLAKYRVCTKANSNSAINKCESIVGDVALFTVCTAMLICH